jgi:hypothetical protein
MLEKATEMKVVGSVPSTPLGSQLAELSHLNEFENLQFT